METLEWLWEVRDKRMDGLPLLSSPLPTAAICLTYVFIVKVAGPRFMRDREPYNIRSFLIVYNALQVALSAYIVYWVCLTTLLFILLGHDTIPLKFYFFSACKVGGS